MFAHDHLHLRNTQIAAADEPRPYDESLLGS